MKLDQAQFKELTNIIETTVKDQISLGKAGSITSITELRKTQVSLKKSIDLLTEQGKKAEAGVLQKQLKTTNLQIGQMLGAQKQLSQELAENDELIEKKLLAMQEKGVELSKGAKTYLKQVEKEREKERKKTERKDESKFMRFIKAPGRALGVVNDKMGSAKEAMGSFLGKTKIGKFASLLAKPISKSLANVISKIFPYKNIVEFLLSPAGMTIVITLFTILKNLVWIPLVKWYNDHIQSKIDFIVDWGNEIKEQLKYIIDFWVEKYGELKDKLNNISDFWVEKYGELKTNINDNIIQPLKSLWDWLKGLGGAIKNMAAIVGAELLNKLSTMINNAFINPLKSFKIFGKYPFSSIKTIPKVSKPDLDPATVKFLSGASQLDEVKQGSQDIVKKLINTENAVVSMDRVKQRREATRTSVIKMMEEKEQERNRRETIQIAKLNEVQKSITENTEINKTIITNNKATGITINASKESMREFAPDFTGLTYSIAGGMGTF